MNQKLIKQFHFELKSGVFEDRANGYAIGDYKTRPTMIGMYAAVKPSEVEAEMEKLLFRECLSYYISPIMIEDSKRQAYLEGLKAYHKAVVLIDEGIISEGYLPKRQLKFVLAWAEIHKDELMQNWELSKDNKPLNRINPLI